MLTFNENGWCIEATQVPSPNFDSRPTGTTAELIVIHNISLPPGEFGGPYIADLFLNRLDFDVHPYFDRLRNARVSAHFLVRRDGELKQFVSVHKRAWHAGVSNFRGRSQCNDFSIGIEMEGTDDGPYTDSQYRVLADLTVALAAFLPVTSVVSHQVIAPARKTDPGPHFDWARYEKEVLSNANLELGFYA